MKGEGREGRYGVVNSTDDDCMSVARQRQTTAIVGAAVRGLGTYHANIQELLSGGSSQRFAGWEKSVWE